MIELQREYNELAEYYERNRGLFDMTAVLESFWNKLSCHNGKLLDLGCGAGEPFARWFIDRGWQVDGVDYSSKMLELACKYVPGMKTIQADMRDIELDEHDYDAVTAIYSLFHLPIADQILIFRKVGKWIKPGGKFLFTYATSQYTGHEKFSGYIEFMQKKLYYSHTTPAELRSQLREAGLSVLAEDYLDIGGETFLWVTAELPG